MPGDAPATDTGPIGPVLDPRETMRKLIQSISAFARGYRRDFVVIAQSGLELLVKRDLDDETRVAPARTYMRSIDGVLQEALFYGSPEMDKPTSKDRREALLKLTQTATKNGLTVLVMDYARTRKAVDAAYRLSRARGYAPFVANDVASALSSLPPYPRYPVDANSANVMSLQGVKNFLYLRNTSGFGRQDEFAIKLHGTNFDLVVVDVFHRTGEPLSRRAVETLKFKKLGARRLVLAHMNIGAAETDRFYWRPHWREGSPIWISAPYPGSPDKYFVEYWRPVWQQIITGNTNSYVYGIVDQGFDGVLLDGLEAYRYFEGGIEAVELTQ